jgi:ornithine carbamoyltransferase
VTDLPTDFLSADDVTADQLTALLDLADELKADRAARTEAGKELSRDELHGRTVALLFEKPSTRTRVSFQVGVTELGGRPLPLSSAELQLGRGETIADTGAVLSRYVHAVVVRTFGQDRVEELAAGASIPVVNALTDLEHPCQALADLQTLRETHGELAGRTLAYVGDVIGHEISSRNDLTKDEASRVIDALEAEKNAEKPADTEDNFGGVDRDKEGD